MQDLRERFLQTNGIKLHVIEAGPEDGPMILFLHGFPEFWYAWRRQIRYFAEQGYLVVAPDQRGYNLSDKPKGIAPYRQDELASDVVGIADAYGHDRIFLAGHDWGAYFLVDGAQIRRANQKSRDHERASPQGNEHKPANQPDADSEELVHLLFPAA